MSSTRSPAGSAAAAAAAVQGADRSTAVLVVVVATGDVVVVDGALEVVLATEVVVEGTVEVVVALVEVPEQPAATIAIAANEEAAATRPHRRESGPSPRRRRVGGTSLAMVCTTHGLPRTRLDRTTRAVVGCMLRQGLLVTAHPSGESYARIVESTRL